MGDDQDLERLLQAFGEAWNRHDIDALMSMMAEDGTRVEVTGCDLLTFRNGKIALKNAYRKNRRPALTSLSRAT